MMKENAHQIDTPSHQYSTTFLWNKTPVAVAQRCGGRSGFDSTPGALWAVTALARARVRRPPVSLAP
ncbi:hypothetical protein NL676_020244 [Syzygium grande]|nr:hypothetical protein NL676_020244 [Syzygium grande]